MAHLADPVLLPPANATEATLRIKESMPDMEANFRLITHLLPSDILARLHRGESIEPMVTYEACSLDATKHVEGISKGRDGLLLRPGTSPGNWSDPFLYDAYSHDEDLSTMGKAETPETFEERKPTAQEIDLQKRTKEWLDRRDDRTEEEAYNLKQEPIKTASAIVDQTVREAIKARLDAIGDPEVTPERLVDEHPIARLLGPTVREPEGKLTYDRDAPRPRRRGKYEPMKSGVWIAAGVNEDDVVALHPDPAKDPQAFKDSLLGTSKTSAPKNHYSESPFEEDPQTAAVRALTVAVEKLTKLVQGL